ncbi:MAG: Thiol-disulfide isomerase-like protein [Fibrobacteres bacterium]|nr:Thiol-disulfide isomerase-like protein [Fibrobacterota bacterium]
MKEIPSPPSYRLPVLSIFLGMALLLSAGAPGAAGIAPPAPSGKNGEGRERASAFRLQDVEGAPFDLGVSLGRDVILLDFWATFCLPCVAELNAFKELQARHGAKGFRVVAISVDQPQTLARVRAFAKARAFPFAVLADPGQDVYRLYGVSALPTSLLIDARGRVAYRQEGFQPGEEKALEERILGLLRERPAPIEPGGSILPETSARDTAFRDSMVDGITLRDPSRNAQATLPAVPGTASDPASSIGSLASRLSLTGSNFLRANQGRENRAQPDANGWLEDWFDARLSEGGLAYQLRYRAYQFLRDLPGDGETLIRDPSHRIVKQSLTYSGSHADIRAGNVYGSAGRGLLFRFFEDRQARLDKDLNGIWAALEGGRAGEGPGRGRVSVFGGKTFSRFPDLHTVDAEEDAFRDLFLQGSEGAWEPLAGFKAGAQYAEAFRDGWNARLAGGNGEFLLGPTAAYLGYMDVTGGDRFNFPHAYRGRALYASLSENLGRLEAGAEYKYYRNYDLGFTDPPSLVQFHTFRLMARDMLFPDNQAEEGAQLRGTWHFREDAFYAANVSRLISHPERNASLLIHHVELPFLDVDQQLRLPAPGDGSLLIDADWIRQRKFSEGEFEDIDAYTLGLAGERPAGPWNLGSSAELQYRDVDFRALTPGDPLTGRLGGAGPVSSRMEAWQGVVSATLGRASLWSLTLDYEATTSEREADPESFHYLLGGLSNGWTSAYLALNLPEGNRITLWAGQRKERVVCAGGSCRLEPAFEGTELIWSSHF